MSAEDGGEVRLRASDADRERIAGLLGEALADGRLTADEHQDRIGVLYATRTLDELAPLTADLGTGRRDVEHQGSAAPVERVARQVVILSSSVARPAGRVAGRMAAFAFLGEARIELTHASFGEDGVEITAQAILGAVNIIVPPDARVTMTGFPLVGSLSPTREPGPAGGPQVKIRAFALFGEVTIHRAEAKADDD